MKHSNQYHMNEMLLEWLKKARAVIIGNKEGHTFEVYLKRAFSAPRIWTVDAGYFARFVRLPAWEINRAPTWNIQMNDFTFTN